MNSNKPDIVVVAGDDYVCRSLASAAAYPVLLAGHSLSADAMRLYVTNTKPPIDKEKFLQSLSAEMRKGKKVAFFGTPEAIGELIDTRLLDSEAKDKLSAHNLNIYSVTMTTVAPRAPTDFDDLEALAREAGGKKRMEENWPALARDWPRNRIFSAPTFLPYEIIPTGGQLPSAGVLEVDLKGRFLDAVVEACKSQGRAASVA